jgi:hypothetical protein
MPDLTLTEIRSAKAVMELAIKKAADDALREFQLKTGLAATVVHVSLARIAPVDRPAFAVVDGVHVDVDVLN